VRTRRQLESLHDRVPIVVGAVKPARFGHVRTMPPKSAIVAPRRGAGERRRRIKILEARCEEPSRGGQAGPTVAKFAV
jgi:hypothetical protein